VHIQVPGRKEVKRITQREMDLTKEESQHVLDMEASTALISNGTDDFFALKQVPPRPCRRPSPRSGGGDCRSLAWREPARDAQMPSGSPGTRKKKCGTFASVCVGALAFTPHPFGARDLAPPRDDVPEPVRLFVRRESHAGVAPIGPPGGGGVAVEDAAFSIRLERQQLHSQEQGIEGPRHVIPNHRAINAAIDSIDLARQFRAAHTKKKGRPHQKVVCPTKLQSYGESTSSLEGPRGGRKTVEPVTSRSTKQIEATSRHVGPPLRTTSPTRPRIPQVVLLTVKSHGV
jgi:hypothetical protein